MIPKARSDVHVNLPALQKLDSMLIVCYVVYHLTLDWSKVRKEKTCIVTLWLMFLLTNGKKKWNNCRKCWTQWWTRSSGMLSVAAERKAGAEMLVRGQTRNGGSHLHVFLIQASPTRKESGLYLRQNSSTKFSRLPKQLMNKSYSRCLFLLLSRITFQRQVKVLPGRWRNRAKCVSSPTKIIHVFVLLKHCLFACALLPVILMRKLFLHRYPSQAMSANIFGFQGACTDIQTLLGYLGNFAYLWGCVYMQ